VCTNVCVCVRVCVLMCVCVCSLFLFCVAVCCVLSIPFSSVFLLGIILTFRLHLPPLPHIIFSSSHFSLSISQPDEDPACFRRIVSYLQLKDLLGDGAPEQVRTVRTLFSPCVSRISSHSLSDSIFTCSFHFFYLQLLANIFISLGMSRSRFRRTHWCSSRGCSSPSVSRMSSVKFFNLLQKSVSQI
jgi:hypothetical protein